MRYFLRSTLTPIFSLGIGGLLGIAYERRKRTNLLVNSLPTVLAKGEADTNDSKTLASTLSEIMRFGFPGTENIKAKENYVLSYNRRLRIANWVCEHLTAASVQKRVADRSKCDFIRDKSIHPLFRATNEDYWKSGYDRGHLAAAANHRQDQDVNCQTFFLSNISPQVGSGFNRDSWEKLEKHVRHLTRVYKNVYVITGPLFLPKQESDGALWIRYKVIGKNRVSVPTHFFKVVLGETSDNKLELQAYILPNQPINEKTALHNFQVPVETIEKASGLVMFDRIQRNKIKEVRPVFS